ncbi:putative ribonuclease H-like domain-containing protein [Tanacetum coccineum]
MEVFTLMLRRQVRHEKKFKYQWGCRELQLLNLCFANDLMMFCHGDLISASVMRRAMDEFCLSFGLKLSMAKSTVYFGNVSNEVKEEIKTVMPFCEGTLLVKYLGIPLNSNRISRSDCTVLLEKIKKGWNEKSPLCNLINYSTLLYDSDAMKIKVADLISEDGWKWPRAVWINKKGKEKSFSVNDVWKGIKCNSTKVIWYNHVWFTQCVPRHSFILWMAIRGRLKTQDRLSKWLNIQDMSCLFCKQFPTGRYVVPTGRVIATDSEIVAASGRDPRGNIMILPPVTVEEQIAVTDEDKSIKLINFIKDNEEVNAKQEFLQTFKISESEVLHMGMMCFQSASQLNQIQARPDNEDCNMKFLRAFTTSWTRSTSTVTIPLTLPPAAASGNILKMFLHIPLLLKSEPTTQITYEYFDQIGKMDLEELDIKWQMAMLSVRINRFEKKAGYGDDTIIPTDDAPGDGGRDSFSTDGVFVDAGNSSVGVSVAAGVDADSVSVATSDAIDAETEFALMRLSPQCQVFRIEDNWLCILVLQLGPQSSSHQPMPLENISSFVPRPPYVPTGSRYRPTSVPAGRPYATSWPGSIQSNGYWMWGNDGELLLRPQQVVLGKVTGYICIGDPRTMDNPHTNKDIVRLKETVTWSGEVKSLERNNQDINFNLRCVLCGRTSELQFVSQCHKSGNQENGFSVYLTRVPLLPRVQLPDSNNCFSSSKATQSLLLAIWPHSIHKGKSSGIKRDYSVARTPQQNGVAERKNRTLIEAARTMLADSKLPTMFWTEAVSTACYVHKILTIMQVPSSAGSINQAAGGSAIPSTPSSSMVEPVHANDTPFPPGHSLGSSENSTPHIDVDLVPTRRVHTVHPISQIIRDISSPVLTRGSLKKSKFRESALAGYVHDQQRNNHTDYLHCLFACFLSQLEPSSVAQALNNPDWVEAMQEEMQQFVNQEVWKLVPLPEGKTAIGTK